MGGRQLSVDRVSALRRSRNYIVRWKFKTSLILLKLYVKLFCFLQKFGILLDAHDRETRLDDWLWKDEQLVVGVRV